ncbi:chemotaxis protein CheC [Clostridium sp. UBA1056]|uniref:chemotaxis protein CheC n=1 Tax=unclassified Clostridium TaxID=2614128 RepID=UPI003216ADA9
MGFTELQIDALREIGNIGLGNAATAMSQILGKGIHISVPKVNFISLEDVFERIDEETVVYAVVARVLGEAPGNILFVFDTYTMMKITKRLVGKQDGEDLNEIGYSALGEIGNIIFATYMSAIGQVTNLKLFPSVPAVTKDMLTAILSTTFIESGQFNDYVLDIETGFSQENEDLRGDFYFIPSPGSLEKILESLGLN